ncbi:MAG: apolipoprotein N-acyltransferase, partial [Pseudomonadota bacterium]
RKLQATAAAPAADLVIWPETALTTWMQEADPIFAEAARVGQGAELLIGANSFVGGQAFNALAHVSDGALTATYEKAHLVPFGEYMPLRGLFERVGIFGLSELARFGFHPGPGPAVLDVPGIGLVQPLICYESIFSYEVRRVAERPRLIAVVTNDAWFGELGGPAQHLAQSQARAIEMGLPVARSANTGISAIIDARGRIVTSLPLGVAGHVDAPLPAALPPTFYARFGEWVFALLAILALLMHLARRRFDFD